MKRIIGMSTGVLYRSISSVSQQIIDFQKTIGCSAIEISCIKKEELPGLTNLNAWNIGLQFGHVSLHAPTDLQYKDNEETKQVLALISEADKRFQFDLVVMHPDTIEDWLMLKDLPFPIGIENSDWRKDFGKTVDDMVEIFNDTPFSFVLDVNHCFSNDKSMGLAKDFVARFSDRLREIHLSGFTTYHEPICVTEQEEILEVVPDGDIPIIIESVCADEAEARRELQYVRNYFN